MADSTIPLNPYDVLGIAPETPISEIPKAFAAAMRLRQHSPQALAKARKCLMNPEERLMADYSRPLLPTEIADPKLEDFTPLHSVDEPLEFLPDLDELTTLVTSISAQQPSAADLRVGETLPERR